MPIAANPPSVRVVTLQIDGRLRGCIGHLDAVQPVVVDVAENAFAAAFRDPRFSPLTRDEWPRVAVHLSLLTRPVPLRIQIAITPTTNRISAETIRPSVGAKSIPDSEAARVTI